MKLIAKALTLGAALFMVGCATPAVDGKSASEASMEITRGMSYSQVVVIASGFPVERTFHGRGTALQFCGGTPHTGRTEFIVVWLVDDVVEGLTQYQGINYFDGCNLGFREVDWGQAPADVKIALDIR